MQPRTRSLLILLALVAVASFVFTKLFGVSHIEPERIAKPVFSQAAAPTPEVRNEPARTPEAPQPISDTFGISSTRVQPDPNPRDPEEAPSATDGVDGNDGAE